MSLEKIANLIDGELRAPRSGKYLNNENPATGTTYSLVPDSDSSDVEVAIAASEKAFPSWSSLSETKRANYLQKISQKIISKLEVLAHAESIDTGKPISLARKLDIPRSAENFSFFAEAMTRLRGDFFRTQPNMVNLVRHSSLGSVGCISPWNLPLYLFTWKIAPALAAGNTVVAKPSEVTPMSAFLFSQITQEVDLPPGVLNIVHGRGPSVGQAIVEHPRIQAVSFTGSTAVGKQIASLAAKQLKKVSLELGGKNPNIIFADADFEQAVSTTVRSSFLNQGQICLCGSRIFIEKSLFERFKETLIEKTKALRIGNPLSEEVDFGSLASKAQMEKVLSYIDLAKKEGGKILCGGNRITTGEFANGYFVEPTLIEGLSYRSRVNQEEIFGPVATLIPFENEDDVIHMANSTNYGLAASIWTKDEERAYRVGQKIKSGVVWINCWMARDLRTPFGGMKDSGIGREGGEYALKFFSEVQNICIQSGGKS